MDLTEFIRSNLEGEKVLIVYPRNEVFFSMSKLIAEIWGRDRLRWYVFNEVAKRRLESSFRLFEGFAPKNVGKMLESYDEVEPGIVIAYGYHFSVFDGGFDEKLIRLLMNRNATVYFFLLRGAIDERKERVLRDLFDSVIEVEERDLSLEKTYLYSVAEYRFPFREFSGAFSIDRDYSIFEG
ncbi:MAG: hypothetical protein GXO67_02380 [Archaeoglobi archaeon]|nr:hypothetical protein [Archaeoglobi archaeon]